MLKREFIDWPDGTGRIMIAEIEDEPNAVLLMAQARGFAYAGRFSKRLLKIVYRKLVEGQQDFEKTAGFFFGIRFCYDLTDPGDGKLSTFYIQINRDAVGQVLYRRWKEALVSLGLHEFQAQEVDIRRKSGGRTIGVESGVRRDGSS